MTIREIENRAKEGLKALPPDEQGFWKGYWQSRIDLIPELSALIPSEEQVKEILRLFIDEYRKVMLIQIESDRKREYERLEDKIIKAICSQPVKMERLSDD
jgi:hypothetical protein